MNTARFLKISSQPPKKNLGKVVRVEKCEDEEYDYALAFVPSDVKDEEYLRLFQDLINKAIYFG
jgi:hypothetical protein